MKLAIHHRPGSFSDRWIAYCEQQNIPFKVVNAFDSNIIEQVKDCDVFMWHHSHGHYKDVLTAKRILFALEHAGVKVFPDFKTGWHFDDKVAQKYLLEAIGVPLVPSYVFYDKAEALTWAQETEYPKVFKLKGGAGAANVKLVKTKKEASTLINKAFDKGFSQFNRLGALKERYRKYKEGKGNIISVVKGLARLFILPNFAKNQPYEKGYVYFQNFVPENDSDIRVIIINNNAFAIRRYVRQGDFRASGSGNIEYSEKNIDKECIKMAFEINEKIQAQSIAYDFIFDTNNLPFIVEVSYGFAVEPYDLCPGYWDENLYWHEESFNPQEWMIEGILNFTEKR